MCASLKLPASALPRWPLVPKATRCAGSAGSGGLWGVHAEEQRPGDASPGTVFGDRLGDGEDVRFVEAAIQSAAAVAAGAEGDALRRIGEVGKVTVVGGEQRRDIGETGGRGRLAGERMRHHVLLDRVFLRRGRRS
jgi:hypothetical protein